MSEFPSVQGYIRIRLNQEVLTFLRLLEQKRIPESHFPILYRNIYNFKLYDIHDTILKEIKVRIRAKNECGQVEIECSQYAV